ncbi:MAG: aminopeptidase [Deltaproteobacteria bacterium]|nr:aminopeptidase [Deltaproteobacteria bacterium]
MDYLIHAASGQWRLLRNSIPVEEALKKDLKPREKAQLLLVGKVKDFGERELGLKRTQNYQSIYLTSDKEVVYVVSAAPKDRLSLLSWWFPIVGRLPYLGFFDIDKAREEKENLEKKGYDVTLGVAEAYSTLGWFKDPITRNLIKGSTLDLVETILHEMTHVTLYIKDEGEFNEGLANFVGKLGAVVFLGSLYGSSHPLAIEAKNVVEDQRAFSSFLAELLRELDSLYKSPISYSEKLKRREVIFSKAVHSFNRLKARFKTNRFIYFGSSGLNNAYILSIGLYHRHFHLFEDLYLKKGRSLAKLMDFLVGLKGKKGSMWEKIRMGEKEYPAKSSGISGANVVNRNPQRY